MGNGYAMDCNPIGKGTSCGFTDGDVTSATNRANANAAGTGAGASGGKGGGGGGGGGASSAGAGAGGELSGPQYGFYCYNPWAYYMAMSNHLRVNNDTAFLTEHAASSSKTVQDALRTIVLDWKNYLIPGTSLVDYGR
jgi:hypothetical protein